jgi:amino acid permease
MRSIIHTSDKVNRFVLKKLTFVIIIIVFILVSNLAFLDKVQSNAHLKIKNVIIIIVKICIICDKKFHTTSEYREQFNFKRDRDQFDEEKNDRNDNDNDEKHHANIDNENDKNKIYIIINFNILTIINVMFRAIVH